MKDRKHRVRHCTVSIHTLIDVQTQRNKNSHSHLKVIWTHNFLCVFNRRKPKQTWDKCANRRLKVNTSSQATAAALMITITDW